MGGLGLGDDGGIKNQIKNTVERGKVTEANNKKEQPETKSTVTESKKTIEEKKKIPPNSGSRRKKKGGVLRYPYEALTANTDYLQIDIIEYK